MNYTQTSVQNAFAILFFTLHRITVDIYGSSVTSGEKATHGKAFRVEVCSVYISLIRLVGRTDVFGCAIVFSQKFAFIYL